MPVKYYEFMREQSRAGLEHLCDAELDKAETKPDRYSSIGSLLIDEILYTFDLPAIDKSDYPRVYNSLDQMKDENVEEKFIQKFAQRNNSFYHGESNIIFLRNPEIDGFIEECMHFVDICLCGELRKSWESFNMADGFYAHILAEASAHFGVKVIFGREFNEHAFRGRTSYGLYEDHLRFEKEYKTTEQDRFDEICPLAKIFEQDKDVLNEVIHLLGYRLGERIYGCYAAEKFSDADFRQLITLNLREANSAIETYLGLIDKLE